MASSDSDACSHDLDFIRHPNKGVVHEGTYILSNIYCLRLILNGPHNGPSRVRYCLRNRHRASKRFRLPYTSRGTPAYSRRPKEWAKSVGRAAGDERLQLTKMAPRRRTQLLLMSATTLISQQQAVVLCNNTHGALRSPPHTCKAQPKISRTRSNSRPNEERQRLPEATVSFNQAAQTQR